MKFTKEELKVLDNRPKDEYKRKYALNREEGEQPVLGQNKQLSLMPFQVCLSYCNATELYLGLFNRLTAWIGFVIIGGAYSTAFSRMKWAWCVTPRLVASAWQLTSRQGKTVQIVTFLGTVIDKWKAFPALVVVPNSTITNWVREFERVRLVPPPHQFCSPDTDSELVGSKSSNCALLWRIQIQRDHQAIWVRTPIQEVRHNGCQVSCLGDYVWVGDQCQGLHARFQEDTEMGGPYCGWGPTTWVIVSRLFESTSMSCLYSISQGRQQSSIQEA